MNKEYKRFLTFLFPHKGKAIIVGCLAFVQAALNTIAFLMIPQILFILNPDFNSSSLGFEGSFNPLGKILQWMIDLSKDLPFFDRIISIVSLMVGIFLLKNFISYGRRILT